MGGVAPVRPDERLLTMRSGGYALVLAGLLALGLLIWAVAPAVFGTASRPPGDGRDVDTYGFDISNLQIPRAAITPAMRNRDMVKPQTGPGLIPGTEMAELNKSRGKFVLDSDRVVGVTIEGESRAYPISVLNVHEVIHDTLAGRPIAVTYHWPCDSVAVFDREVGGRVLEFGVSGLLYNSNQLLYDRNGNGTVGGESLWSQMLGRAVSGAAAGAGHTLRPIPYQLVSWRDWFAEHPETTVTDRDPSIVKKRYAKASPEQYFRDGRIRFPVDPEPPADGPPPLTRVVAVDVEGERLVFPHPLIGANADEDGRWATTLGDASLEFRYDEPTDTVGVTVTGEATSSVTHAAWFAWHAIYPDDRRAQ